jgi:hypothetical protein
MLSSSQYSSLDRSIHNLAFGSSILQEILTDLEKSLLAKQWANIQVTRPIFITSLPRAGTTIILEALHRLPGLATHTYRDMPFILTPVLWAKVASAFRSQSSPEQERAHGDGLAINEDSPEAFEEVLWLKFFAEKYSDTRIALWGEKDTKIHFERYFREHMQKIVYLRHGQNAANGRYVSKNNANVARTKALKTMFPDACIVIPLRNPVEHAISLLRQHRNFCNQHHTEPFVRKYMSDIGHFEFGELHRPIQFPGAAEKTENLSLESIDYWVAYWIAAFEHLGLQQNIDFLSYESLCTSGEKGLSKLCQHLNFQAKDHDIAQAASIFRPPPARRSHDYVINPDLMENAMQLYNRLCERCLLTKADKISVNYATT